MPDFPKVLTFVLIYLWTIIKYFLFWAVIITLIGAFSWCATSYPEATLGVIVFIVVFIIIPAANWPRKY